MKIFLTLPLLALLGVTLVSGGFFPDYCKNNPENCWKRKRDADGIAEKREAVEEAKEKRTSQYDPMYDFDNCVRTMQYQGTGYRMDVIYEMCRRRMSGYKREADGIVEKRETEKDVRDKRAAGFVKDNTRAFDPVDACVQHAILANLGGSAKKIVEDCRRLNGKFAADGIVEKREASEKPKEKRAAQYDPMYDFNNCVAMIQQQGTSYSMDVIYQICNNRLHGYKREADGIVEKRDVNEERTIKKRDASEEPKEKRAAQYDPMYDFNNCVAMIQQQGTSYNIGTIYQICNNRLRGYKREADGIVEKREVGKDIQCKPSEC